jgi:hypothetical protein
MAKEGQLKGLGDDGDTVLTDCLIEVRVELLCSDGK